MALEFLAGCVGGCAGVVVGHPFDTIKVRLQTQDPFNPKFKGTWDCFTSTIKSESFRGLYKGMSSPMAGVAVINALVFGVHGNLIKLFDDPNAIRSQCLAGAGAGLTQSVVVSPMELVKTRMQIQSNGPSSIVAKYSSPMQCFKSILRQNGVRGIFRGQLITVFREVPGFATYFATYEYLVRKMSTEEDNPSTLAILMAGGIAGTASWVLTFPLDVVKSRLQADGMSGDFKYKGMIHCLKESLKAEGYSFLSRGLSSTIIRAFPTNAATFTVVNFVMNFGMAAEEDEYASAAWQDVLNRGEILVNAASAPPSSNYFTVLNNQQQHLSNLERVIKSPLDLDRENTII